MMLTTNLWSRRKAATAVELAFVLIPLIMLIMGIFQYGLILMDWNLLINSASQGCRFALANNKDTNISTEVQNIVTNYMAGRNSNFNNFTVTVTGTHGGISTPVNNLAAGDPITVTVTGNYRFVNFIPLVSTPGSLPMSTSATMICEGGP
ncbi:MAG TPA: TadE/TadG family type IV pilus assembly protein [Gemmataceae bacterium]|jgi:Flp pilus assembly protein TadG